jgi:type II secretory ATPase GspE/PulE/Tfp pilus assembly ATPase PilB-like protein
VEPVVVTSRALDAALARLTGATGPARGVLHASAPPRSLSAPPGNGLEAAGSQASPADEVAGPGVVGQVQRILSAAEEVGASDIHVEPGADGLVVRARVDGVLRQVLGLPAHASPAVVSRLKIMAGLDISVKRLPQDGRATVRAGGRPIDLRVSTLPSVHGEKVVLRMLDPEHAGMGMDELGLPSRIRARLERLLMRAHGALLVTGPTGSGKTTTLYAILASVDRAHRNVVTLEDPIEYRLPGLTQVQVRARSGLTFASALRAVLRQDPDVVMVGEMRDSETAEVGMAAALTGHQVLSTLHTNDAASAVSRLAEMGVAPYMIAAGLSGVLAQRLVRRLCRGCRRPYSADPAELSALGLPARGLDLHDAEGCEGCGGRGYRGRTGIFELLEIDAGVREAILRREGPDRLRSIVRNGGAGGLAQQAAVRLGAGETSLGEVAPFLALLASG